MANTIIGIPTTRVTESYTRGRILRQTQPTQTGRSPSSKAQLSQRLSVSEPSDDPVAAMQVMSLQRLLQRKTQVKSNLSSTQSYLGVTDTSLSSVFQFGEPGPHHGAGRLGNHLAPTSSGRPPCSRSIRRSSNSSTTAISNSAGGICFPAPNRWRRRSWQTAGGYIQYDGNEQSLMSYSDLNLLTRLECHRRTGVRRDLQRNPRDRRKLRPR